jgi:hypothetical protein
VLFFEAATGGGQIGGINQSHRPRLPDISGEQRREQVLVDSAQSCHAHATPELVHHPHVGHPVLTTQPGEFSPRALFRKHFDQQVHGMHRREQTQPVNAKELGRGVFAMPPAGGAARPAFVDEIVGHKRIQEFEQRHRAGGRKVGIHGSQTTPGNLTRQRQ